MVKGIKLHKRKIKEKEKSGVRIRPSSAGYGLGTQIRATLARIFIPGPGTDPLLRILSGCLPKSMDLLDYLGIFMDFYGLL